MRRKTIDLAAGRLGPPALGPGPSAVGDAAGSTNYGVGRLGISTQADAEPDARDRPAPVPREAPVRPVTAGWSAYVSPPPEPMGLPRPARAGRGARRIVLTGAMAGAIVIGLIVLGAWYFRDDDLSPQVAAADEGPPAAAAAETPVEQRVPPAPAEPAARGRDPRVKFLPAPPKPAGPSVSPARAGPSYTVRALPPQESRQVSRRRLDVEMIARTSGPPLTAAGTSTARPWAATSRPAPRSRRTKPTTGPSGFEVALNGLEVSGVIRGLGRPVAIINNRFVAEGETIGKTKVIRVEEFWVELEVDGRRFKVQVAVSSAPGFAEEAPKDDDATDAEAEKESSKED